MAKQPSTPIVLYLIGLMCIIIIALQIALPRRASAPEGSGASRFEESVQLASRLRARSLPQAALKEYESALLAPAPAEKKANVAYLAGNIAFEDLRDAETALAFYERSLFHNSAPDAAVKRKIAERISECQERLGRSLDAAATLRQATDLRSADMAAGPDDIVAARIGDREITVREIEQAMQRLPESVQKQLASPSAKLEFARGYLAQELLLAKAKRENLAREPDVALALSEAERGILARAALERETSGKAAVQPGEAKLYYDAHPQEFVSPGRARVAGIRFSSEAAAAEAKRRLDDGADFAGLAAEFAADEAGRASGGDMGWIVDGENAAVPGVPDSAEAARRLLTMSQDQATSPMALDGAYYLFKIAETRPAETAPFERVEASIQQRLLMEREMGLQQQLIDRLMAAENARIFEDAFGAAPAPAPTAEE